MFVGGLTLGNRAATNSILLVLWTFSANFGLLHHHQLLLLLQTRSGFHGCIYVDDGKSSQTPAAPPPEGGGGGRIQGDGHFPPPRKSGRRRPIRGDGDRFGAAPAPWAADSRGGAPPAPGTGAWLCDCVRALFGNRAAKQRKYIVHWNSYAVSECNAMSR